MLGRALSQLGLGVVDVLGLSWGGAMAQQFAFQNPRRCRRLALVATGTGILMVPAHPTTLAKMAASRRFSDPDYAASIAGELYGGTVRAHGEDVARLFVWQLHAGSKVGYSGTDDPIIPVINARIMNALLPHSRLHLHPGGHIDLVYNAVEPAPVVERFLHDPLERC
ncbi:poly(3-hydroxyalkanoic acid) depolymerase [Mycobacterium shigaense]|uniref:Poly(3-hydroxyalkanoic acid) depolymerase n=1 Tax=Mycobacterium shigaense TaxID=722731 RepID=A0A1Z4EEK5_9MYCO|nr:poly(3-hydroxyalkanoic acid) depolymerase [Mycobacterium shigaense]